MDPMRNAMLAGLGVFSFASEKISGIVQGMIDRGDLTREQGEKVLSEWVKRGEEEESRIGDRLSEQFQSLMNYLQVVRREDFDALEARVEALEKKLNEPS